MQIGSAKFSKNLHVQSKTDNGLAFVSVYYYDFETQPNSKVNENLLLGLL